MQPLFPESGTRWPFQFARDGTWMYAGCFLGCETSGGRPGIGQPSVSMGVFIIRKDINVGEALHSFLWLAKA